MDKLTELKAAARKVAFARRKEAKTEEADIKASENLLSVLLPHKGKSVAGYMPIRTEVTPLPTMAAISAWSKVGVPVIEAEATPLSFREWTPDAKMIDGPFGASIPAKGNWITPQVVVVPLVAFDRKGGRLGYGGGFYDRTLEGLRSVQPTIAIGYAFAAQEAGGLPLEPTDQPLDMVVTEREIISF